MKLYVILSVLSAAGTVHGQSSSSHHSKSHSSSHSASASSISTAPPVYNSSVPLAAKEYNYTNLPYQVDPYNGTRGEQYGYNICNDTTAGPDSLCQTAIINSLDDFCLWAPPELGIVGDLEGEMVAWCTKDTHGARTIPAGALTGVQFIRTPHYVQVTGRIDQTLINIAANDSGGELDPHGADQRGNPLGGLVFSNAFGGGNVSVNSTTEYTNSTLYGQVVQWHNFIGGSIFCFKACDPSYGDQWRMCEHIYDRIGCAYNAPAAYEEGVFESCLGDDQMFPGYYIGADNKTSVYTQPAESLGAITSIPYTAVIPKSSMCVQYDSASMYGTVTANASTSVTDTAAVSVATDTAVVTDTAVTDAAVTDAAITDTAVTDSVVTDSVATDTATDSVAVLATATAILQAQNSTQTTSSGAQLYAVSTLLLGVSVGSLAVLLC